MSPQPTLSPLWPPVSQEPSAEKRKYSRQKGPLYSRTTYPTDKALAERITYFLWRIQFPKKSFLTCVLFSDTMHLLRLRGGLVVD